MLAFHVTSSCLRHRCHSNTRVPGGETGRKRAKERGSAECEHDSGGRTEADVGWFKGYCEPFQGHAGKDSLASTQGLVPVKSCCVSGTGAQGSLVQSHVARNMSGLIASNQTV